MKNNQKKAVFALALLLLAALIYYVFSSLKPTQGENHRHESQTQAQGNTESHAQEQMNDSHTSTHPEANQHNLSTANVDMAQMKPVNTAETKAPDTVTSTIGRFGVAAPDISHEAISTEQNAEQLMLATCASNRDVMASAIAEYKADYAMLLSSFGIERVCKGDVCDYMVGQGALVTAFAAQGLTQGDVITHINNISVNDIASVDDFLQLFNFKSTNALRVSRAGQSQLIELNCSSAEFTQLPSYTDPTNPAKNQQNKSSQHTHDTENAKSRLSDLGQVLGLDGD